jgi:outer membrane protein OmpA-like peptidoglycan-associated protein
MKRPPYSRPCVAALLLLVTSLASCTTVKERVEQEADERVDEAVDEGVETTADAAENALKNAARCAVSDQACIDEAQQQGQTVVLTDEEGNVKRDENGDPVTASEAGAGSDTGDPGVTDANANYDFEPGERTIFATDFSSVNTGDFPRSLAFKSGTMEIVEWKGGRALHAKSGGAFEVELSEPLPETFTLTFDVQTTGYYCKLSVNPVDADGEIAANNHLLVSKNVGTGVAKTDGADAPTSRSEGGELGEAMTPIRVTVDGAYVKVYTGKKRVANIPNAELGRTRTLRFNFYGCRGGDTTYLGDIRVGGGGNDLYGTLESEGRVAVQDLTFDTGEATLKPTSDETLKQIATLMQEHPGLTLLVEGHTDDAGSYEANMTLSKERAAAVKEALVQTHGIDAARLKTKGQGSTQPAASNDTEQGRAENRRVELVKL